MPVTSAEQNRAREDYQRADTRWTASSAHDWLVLIVIAAFQILWMMLVFFFEPGIR